MSFVDTNFITSDARQDTSAETLEAEQEIAELYQQYEEQISAYALRRTSSADANDVVAETFLTAWRRRDDIPAEPKTLPWLYGVSRRVLANQRRSEDRRSRLRDRLKREPATASSAVTFIESADAFAEVTTAIRSMSEDDAEILRLTAWEGLGPTEIAETLGIEPTAARQRLFRARQRLTGQLDRQAAEKARREKMYKVAAVVVAVLLTGAGLIGVGLLRPDSTIETDFIDQDRAPDGVSDSSVGEGDGGDAAPSIIQTDGDASSISGPVVVEEQADPVEVEAENSVPVETPAPELAQQTGDQAPPQDASAQSPDVAASVGSAPERSNATANAANSAEPNTAEANSVDGQPDPTAPPAEASATQLQPSGPYVPGVDLFVVQLDFAALDDGHSAVATAEAVTAHGVDALVVAGTAALDSERFTHDYVNVMNATYGGNWVDAGAERATAIDTLATAWIVAVDRGGDIWIAEGGVSDFTAEVLREVQARRPNLNTASRVHVVHHAGRNINDTVPDDLALLTAATDFTQIDDGNENNGTADLQMPSAGFEAAAAQSQFSQGWAAAFDAMPASELDFSDTITALYLLGVDKDQVATTDDFQQLFLR